MFEKFTCTLSDGRTVTVDINTETYFISDASDPDNPDWMPNGKERKEIVEFFMVAANGRHLGKFAEWLACNVAAIEQNCG